MSFLKRSLVALAVVSLMMAGCASTGTACEGKDGCATGVEKQSCPPDATGSTHETEK